MGDSFRRGGDDGWIRASDLAAMGTCERQIRFRALHGVRLSREQRGAIDRGLKEHAAFYRESLVVGSAARNNDRCCIAAAVLGPSRDTNTLRNLRDSVLRRSFVGRWVIALYYRSSPVLCRLVRAHPALRQIAAAALRCLARVAECLARPQSQGAK
jgi:hypothetical protein